LETNSLRNDLRLVILTDFIRKDDFQRNEDDIKEIKKIGVVPIFEQIRRARIDGINLGILSGSLVVIPKSAEDLLNEIATELRIQSSHIKKTPLKHSSDEVVKFLVEINKAAPVDFIIMHPPMPSQRMCSHHSLRPFFAQS
jgi:hypothetical protein